MLPPLSGEQPRRQILILGSPVGSPVVKSMSDVGSSTQLAPNDPYAQQSESMLHRAPAGMQQLGSSGTCAPETVVDVVDAHTAHIAPQPVRLVFGGVVPSTVW
jgi:hypothetical protein